MRLHRVRAGKPQPCLPACLAAVLRSATPVACADTAPILFPSCVLAAGVTSAMFLASAGYQVDVLETRGHPAEMEVDKKRTYLIGLGEAAAHAAALEAVELSCKETCVRAWCYYLGGGGVVSYK